MPTDAPPVTPPPQPPATVTTPDGRTLRLGEFDPEVGAHTYLDESGKPWIPYSRFKESREEVKALKAKTGDPEAEKAIRERVRAEVEQEYAQRVVEAQMDGALYRHGLDDDEEVRGEVLSRYSAVKPDAEGKRPSLSEWLKAQREANGGQGARWIRSYLRTDAAPATPKPDAASEVKPEVAPKPKPASNPNGGVAPGGAPPPGTGFTNEQARGLNLRESIQNLDALRAAEGLPPYKRRGT